MRGKRVLLCGAHAHDNKIEIPHNIIHNGRFTLSAASLRRTHLDNHT